MSYNSQTVGGLKKLHLDEEKKTIVPSKKSEGKHHHGFTVSKPPHKNIPLPKNVNVGVMTPKDKANLLQKADETQELQRKAKQCRKESAEAGVAEGQLRKLANTKAQKEKIELQKANKIQSKAVRENNKGHLSQEKAAIGYEKAEQKKIEGAQYKKNKEFILEDVQQQLQADRQKTQMKLKETDTLLSSVTDMLAAMKKQKAETEKEEAPKGSAPKAESPSK